jgi:hypothetical protein
MLHKIELEKVHFGYRERLRIEKTKREKKTLHRLGFRVLRKHSSTKTKAKTYHPSGLCYHSFVPHMCQLTHLSWRDALAQLAFTQESKSKSLNCNVDSIISSYCEVQRGTGTEKCHEVNGYLTPIEHDIHFLTWSCSQDMLCKT